MIKYYPCELHCHTVHSDGDFLPKELQQSAVQNKLSLIALTDHNTISGYDEMDSTIIPFIKGIEWTTYFGHMLVMGTNAFVDWRNAVPDNIDDKISEVKNAGGTVGIAHPFQLGSPFCTGGRWEFNVNKWESVDYIEIWHESFPNSIENDRAYEMWTGLLDKGYHIAPSYGRDWHRTDKKPSHIGCTYLGIDGEINEENALEAIKHGRMIVSAGGYLSFSITNDSGIYNIGDTILSGNALMNITVDLTARADCCADNKIEFEEIKIITNGGKAVKILPCKNQNISINLEKNHWYRAELWGKLNDKKTALAVTGAVYCGY